MRLTQADVRHAFRRLAATPILSLGSILILALGIGSAVVMADVLDRLLLRAPALVMDPERVARVYVRFGRGSSYTEIGAYPVLESLASMRDELEGTAAYYEESLTLGRGEKARRLAVVARSRSYFGVLGVEPLLGSWTEPSNYTREDAAVISYALWHQDFGGSHDVLGKPLRLGRDTYTIVAVAPRGFAGIGFTAADVWLPLDPRARAAFGSNWKNGNAFFLRTIARLRPGVSPERAGEHATALYRATRTDPSEKDNSLVFGDLRPARAPGARLDTRVEVLVAAMSILVLLITCGNTANFLLVRGLQRDREFVIKTALGATRPRLVGEVLLEAVLLAASAGAIALLVVTTGGALIRREFLSPVAALASPLDTRVVFITVGFCVVATLLLGLAPAFRLSTRRAANPGHAPVVRPSRVLDLFSGMQVALMLPMIIAAALFVVSLWNARHQDFGMQTDRVVVVSTNLGETGRPLDNDAAHRQIQARVSHLPQVESTAIVENVPMQNFLSFLIDVPGQDLVKATGGSAPYFNGVDPAFFSLMQIRLLRGRLFSDDENRKGAPSVAVISESMARALWPGDSGVGKCFYVGGPQQDAACTEILGVVADARLYPSIRKVSSQEFMFYMPIEQVSGMTSLRALLVRTAREPESAIDVVRREAQAAAPDLPYVDVHAFDDIFATLLKPWRVASIVFVVFGALSIVIAAAGLIVVGAYSVARRTREIGIRSALGAEPQHLVRLVLGRSLLVVVTGLAAGMAIAWASGRILNAQLFEVQASDPRVLLAAVLGSLVVAIVAAWLPARRATRTDPAVALRTE